MSLVLTISNIIQVSKTTMKQALTPRRGLLAAALSTLALCGRADVLKSSVA
jgi:hypothetical protein